MPQIREYQSRVGVAGPSPGRAATASDFGDGSGLAHVGNALASFTEAVVSAQERGDVRTAHKLAAGLRSKWTVGLAESSKYAEGQILAGTTSTTEVGTGPVGIDDRAKPASTGIYQVGAEQTSTSTTREQPKLLHTTFARDFMESLDKDALDARNELTTAAGRQQFDVLMANAQGDMRERAFLAQADLAGKKAKSDYFAILDATRNTLLADPTQLESEIGTLVVGLGSDPNIPAADRQELVRKGAADLAKSAVQGWQQKSPEVAYQKLVEGAFDRYIDADVKASLVNSSIKMIERNEARALAAEQRAEAAARRARNEAQETAFKRDYAKLPVNGGELTMQEVLANIDQYDKADFKTLLDAFTGGPGRSKDDEPNPTYITLRTEAGKGRDVRGAANKAYRSGVISRSMYDKVLGEVESNAPTVQRENWYKAGKAHISDMLGASSLTATGLEKQIGARAVDDWNQWAAANPGASPEQAEKTRDQIVRSYQTVAYHELTITQPLPYETTKARGDIDEAEIGEAVNRLMKDKRDGLIGDAEYRKQMESLRVWSDQLRKREESRKKRTEKQKP